MLNKLPRISSVLSLLADETFFSSDLILSLLPVLPKPLGHIVATYSKPSCSVEQFSVCCGSKGPDDLGLLLYGLRCSRLILYHYESSQESTSWLKPFVTLAERIHVPCFIIICDESLSHFLRAEVADHPQVHLHQFKEKQQCLTRYGRKEEINTMLLPLLEEMEEKDWNKAGIPFPKEGWNRTWLTEKKPS